MLRLIFAGFLLLSPLPASAGIVTYVFHQTSSSLPGLHFTGQYTIDDSLAFPTVTSDDAAIDFGGLLSLSFTGGGVYEISLADFRAADYTGYPSWSINPSELYYNDTASDYTIGLGTGGLVSVAANTDDQSTIRLIVLSQGRHHEPSTSPPCSFGAPS